MLTIHTDTPTGFLTAPKPLPGARHVFGTKADTHSETSATVRAYTERLGPLAHMKQVHGNRVVYAHTSGVFEECDAVYTDHDDFWLAVKTADCCPVLISSPAAVAAVHVGWRGLESGVLPATIQTLCTEFAQDPADLHVVLGPCISQKHFEVEAHFANLFDERYFTPSERDGHLLMDLPGLVQQQAVKHGILDIHLTDIGRCTYAEDKTFNSYRRHKQQGTASYAVQLSLIRKRSATA